MKPSYQTRIITKVQRIIIFTGGKIGFKLFKRGGRGGGLIVKVAWGAQYRFSESMKRTYKMDRIKLL